MTSSSSKSSLFDKDTQSALKSLKQQLKTSTPLPTPKPQPKPVMVEPENEEHLFNQAMQGVRPISQTEPLIPLSKKPKKPDAQTLARRAAAVGQDEQLIEGISDTQAMLNPVASEAVLSYRLATLQHRVFENLKTGKLRWYEAVDLHGCTIEQARSAVLQIIDMAQQVNENVIKIVHGKGPQAILKTYVNGWLRQHREVLAFVSAPNDQGGTGAVLVLLKRNEKNSNEAKSDNSRSKR